jgi:hypothetical protein
MAAVVAGAKRVRVPALQATAAIVAAMATANAAARMGAIVVRPIGKVAVENCSLGLMA